MTIERAIEILNPEHREHYDSIETVNEACRMGMEALEKMRWIPGSVKPTDDYDILKRDVESLRDENKALRRGYTNMWYAHRNADPEMPHDYEKEAEKEAEQLLGDWETVMTAQYGPAPDLSWFKERGDDDGN